MIATGHILVFKFNLKLIEIKYKLKFSSSLKLATFQVFNSQTGLVAAVQRYRTFPSSASSSG